CYGTRMAFEFHLTTTSLTQRGASARLKRRFSRSRTANKALYCYTASFDFPLLTGSSQFRTATIAGIVFPKGDIKDGLLKDEETRSMEDLPAMAGRAVDLIHRCQRAS